LVAMTGLSAEEAANLLEAAGGDVETAASLFLDGGAAPSSPTPAAIPAADVVPQPEFAKIMWENPKGALPASWKQQGLSYTGPACIVQGQNGPCGVIAVVQATAGALWMDELEAEGITEIDCEQKLPSTCFIRALARIIGRCSPSERDVCRVARWEGEPGNSTIAVTTAQKGELESVVAGAIETFLGPGGAVLLVYSCILTRSVEIVTKDMSSGDASGLLVEGPFSLCSYDLIGLLLRGVADRNLFAFNDITRERTTWTPDGVGFLSLEEQSVSPVADALKTPTRPVWVLLSSDHATVAFAPSNFASTSPVSPATAPPSSSFPLAHWNGLAPGGPRLSRLVVSAPDGVAPPAPDEMVPSYRKPQDGEIDGIVQADASDKERWPEEWTRWRFEVVLAKEDPDETAPPPETPPKTFPQGDPTPGPWRCRACYATRYETYCFGMNEGGEVCQYCAKTRQECGWSIWLRYDELTPGWQRTATARHAPRVMSLLQTKWPNATFELVGPAPVV